MINKEDGIRGLAIAFIRKEGKILLSPGFDKSKNEHFYRPIGGGINFGETSQEALKREFKEEIDADITDCQLITVIENIFTYEEKPWHELCFIYEAKFADENLYQTEKFKILDSADGEAIWVDTGDLKSAIVYPAGIINYLD